MQATSEAPRTPGSELLHTWSFARGVVGRDVWVILALLVVLLVVGGLLVPEVFQSENIANVVRRSSVVGLVAVGMTFVLLTGEIDLSVGSIMSLSLVTGGLVLDEGSGVALAVT